LNWSVAFIDHAGAAISMSEISIDPKRPGINLPPMQHSPGFLKLVNEARSRVQEITVDETRDRLARNRRAVLMDVREESEWQAGHAAEAIHLGKGILERDLEKLIPDVDAEIIMYCGGGYRSALTADAAQRMGYRNVYSLIGGYKGLVAAGWPMAR
jgi:rhodanese-related sulfurtransferase